MSRIGKKPIPLPKDVKTEFENGLLTVKGPKGELMRKIHPEVNITIEDNQVVVQINDGKKGLGSLQGLSRALIGNMVKGVKEGFEQILEINGVGYRAELSGKTATFHLGYSHPIVFELPDGINGKIEKTKITLDGIDKELLGRTAAEIRSFRKPEPYKGKGIKYKDEIIKKKAGKTGAVK